MMHRRILPSETENNKLTSSHSRHSAPDKSNLTTAVIHEVPAPFKTSSSCESTPTSPTPLLPVGEAQPTRAAQLAWHVASWMATREDNPASEHLNSKMLPL